MNKKALIIVPFSFYPPTSGGEMGVYVCINALSRHFDITLLFPEFTNQYHQKGLEELKKKFKVVTIPIKETSVNNHDVLTRCKSIFTRFFGKSIIIGIDEFYHHPAVQHLIREPFDFIQVEHSWSYHDQLKERQCPLVLVEHNYEYEYFKQHSFSCFRQGRYYLGLVNYVTSFKIRQQERNALKDADQIFTVSERDWILLNTAYRGCGHKIFVRPLGIDMEPHRRFLQNWKAPDKKSEAIKLVYVGTLAAFQTAEAAIYFVHEIYPRLLNRGVDFEVNIVGRGKVKELNLAAQKDNRIKLAGYVEDVKEYIAQADIYLAPVRYGAGIKIKVIEAMAMGKPLVATSKALEGLDIHCEGIRIADSAEAFADAVLGVARDSALRARMGDACRTYAEAHFDWNRNFLKHLLPIYRQLSENLKIKTQ